MEHSFLWFLLTPMPWDTWNSLVRVEELQQKKKKKPLKSQGKQPSSQVQLPPCSCTGADCSRAAPQFFTEELVFICGWASHEKKPLLWEVSAEPEERWHEVWAVFNCSFPCSVLSPHPGEPCCWSGTSSCGCRQALCLAFPKLPVLRGSLFAKLSALGVQC